MQFAVQDPKDFRIRAWVRNEDDLVLFREHTNNEATILKQIAHITKCMATGCKVYAPTAKTGSQYLSASTAAAVGLGLLTMY